MSVSKMSVQERLEYCRSKFEGIASRAKSATAQPVRLRDEFWRLCLDNGLAYRQRLPPCDVGVWPKNRSASGLVASEPRKKLVRFKKDGFSFAECKKACALERVPGDEGDADELVNIDIASKGAGSLAGVLKGTIEIFTITCSHTNQALRLGYFEVDVSEEDLKELQIDGKLSIVMIRIHDPNLGDACEFGLEWIVIRWQVAKAFPELIDLVADADNVPVGNALRDSTSTLLLKVCKHAAAMCRGADGKFDGNLEKDVDWKLVAQKVHGLETDRSEEVDASVSYRKWFGGLADPWALREFDDYCKSLKTVRMIPHAVLSRLANMDLGLGKGVLFRLACLKLMASSSKADSNNAGMALQVGDVQSFTGAQKKAFVDMADKHMHLARTFVPNLSSLMDSAKIIELQSLLDIRLVYHVLARPSGLGTFKSQGEICLAYVKSMSEASARVKERAADWKALPKDWQAWAKPAAKTAKAGAAKAPAAMPAAAGKGMQGKGNATAELIPTIGAHGEVSLDAVVQLLSEKGIREGTILRAKSSGIEGIVFKIGMTEIVMNIGKKGYKVKLDDLFKTYAICQPSAEKDAYMR